MNCKYHKEAEAKYICEKCKQPVCEECTSEVLGKRVCNRCVQQTLFASPDQPSRGGFLESFAFFCFALMPGAAYMYMNLFRRGFQLMFTTIAAIVVVSYVNIEALIPLIIIPTWFFNFFDSYYIRRKLRNGEFVEDTLVYDYSLVFGYRKYFGAGMLVLGIIGLTNAWEHYNIVQFFGERFSNFFWSVKRSIVPLMLILIGVGILRRSKKNAESESSDTEVGSQFEGPLEVSAETTIEG